VRDLWMRVHAPSTRIHSEAGGSSSPLLRHGALSLKPLWTVVDAPSTTVHKETSMAGAAGHDFARST